MENMTLFDGSYPFKRKFYYTLYNFTQQKCKNVLFLLGPRKCGKTVALLQLKETLGTGAKYINFKASDGVNTAREIKSAIESNKDIIFLIDEITYLECADRAIADWAEVLTEVPNCKTKLIITGSQMVAIKAWGFRAFSILAAYEEISFINYAEWCDYKGLSITQESFNDFVLNSKEFTKIDSVRNYLESCLDETIISNSKSLNIIFNNDCEGLTVKILIAVMYTTMFTLHNHVNFATFRKATRLEDDIHYWFGQTNLDENVLDKLVANYYYLKGLDFQIFRKSILFLLQAGLITVTYFSEGIRDQADVESDLLQKESSLFSSIEDFFLNCNVCIKYPLFYVCVLQELVGTVELGGSLLGSIVECYIRGLLGRFSTEYRNKDAEIDYVAYFERMAIEITISNKKMSGTSLSTLDNTWKKILLTKDIKDYTNGVLRVPYYDFIAKLCGKEKL